MIFEFIIIQLIAKCILRRPFDKYILFLEDICVCQRSITHYDSIYHVMCSMIFKLPTFREKTSRAG